MGFFDWALRRQIEWLYRKVKTLSNSTGGGGTPTPSEATIWKGYYVVGNTYYKHEQVTENGTLAIVNAASTTDSPAPKRIGDAINLYNGTLSLTTPNAKQIIFGARYTTGVDIFITAYSIYTVLGNRYVVYSVTTPEATPIFEELISFTASSTGWQNLNISSGVVQAGAVFDLVVLATVEDSTPDTFEGQWDYNTPNNASIPIAGQIIHANRVNDEVRIHKLDNALTDRSTELLSLEVGDTITAGGIIWTIQGIIDEGTWITLLVTPATQLSSDGIQDFIFTRVSVTPISYYFDTDYYNATPAVQGLRAVDAPYSSIIPDTSAYGVDLVVQQVSVSPDWDIQVIGEEFSESAEIVLKKD